MGGPRFVAAGFCLISAAHENARKLGLGDVEVWRFYISTHAIITQVFHAKVQRGRVRRGFPISGTSYL